MKRQSRLPAVFVVSAVLVGLTACGPGPGDLVPSPSASESTLPTSAPNPSQEPTPTPHAVADECSELLSPASLAEFSGSAYGVADAATITTYVDKIRGEGSPLALFVDGGGLLCPVDNGTRVAELFGFSPITPTEAATQKARLLSEGLTLRPHLGGELLSDTSGSENVVYEYLFVGDYWFCAFDVTRLDEIVANSGAVI